MVNRLQEQGKVKIGFIGAGKVGFTLGKFLALNGMCISGYCSRSMESARSAARFVGGECFLLPSELVHASDIVFLTVPDDALHPVYGQIRDLDLRGKILCHCSGSLSAAEIFSDLAEKGASCCSVHPLFPVNNPRESYRTVGSAVFCLEGDEPALGTCRRMLEDAGVRVRLIEPRFKTLYHAACVFSSNCLCALVNTSCELLARCGFDRDDARESLAPLIRSSMERLSTAGPAAALTGPVERGDAATIRKHLQVLPEEDRELYRQLGMALVKLAREKHPDKTYTEVLDVLCGTEKN